MRRTFAFLLMSALITLGQAWGADAPTPTPTPPPALPTILQGAFWGIGDTILNGRDLKPNQKKYIDLFSAWVSTQYGPVTATLYTDNYSTAEISDQIEAKLSGVTMSLCVLEVGMKNMEYRSGGPNVSTCGGCTPRAALKAALLYGTELQKIITVIQRHMIPGGLLLMTNLYEFDECTQDRFEDWKEYQQVLGMYNKIAAMAAEVNGVKLVDLHALMANNPSYLDSCSLFPNEAGHAAIAELLEKTVKESLASSPKASPKK